MMVNKVENQQIHWNKLQCNQILIDVLGLRPLFIDGSWPPNNLICALRDNVDTLHW